MPVILLILMVFASSLLTLVILVQHGKGGGLAGAFGGNGGQSAFGAKAGPITIATAYIAVAWFVSCVACVSYFN